MTEESKSKSVMRQWLEDRSYIQCVPRIEELVSVELPPEMKKMLFNHENSRVPERWLDFNTFINEDPLACDMTSTSLSADRARSLRWGSIKRYKLGMLFFEFLKTAWPVGKSMAIMYVSDSNVGSGAHPIRCYVGLDMVLGCGDDDCILRFEPNRMQFYYIAGRLDCATRFGDGVEIPLFTPTWKLFCSLPIVVNHFGDEIKNIENQCSKETFINKCKSSIPAEFCGFKVQVNYDGLVEQYRSKKRKNDELKLFTATREFSVFDGRDKIKEDVTKSLRKCLEMIVNDKEKLLSLSSDKGHWQLKFSNAAPDCNPGCSFKHYVCIDYIWIPASE